MCALATTYAVNPHRTIPASANANVRHNTLAARPILMLEASEQPQPTEVDERAMENINRAGPSDKRMADIANKMKQLRKEGKVAGSSIMEESRDLLEIKRAAPPSPAPLSPPPPPLISTSREDEGAAVAATPPTSVVDKDPKLATSGIGGNWVKPAVVEGHKPKVSTWGVFERPADISKAYGGGKRIGVGGAQLDEAELQRKAAEAKAKLAAYREKMGTDVKLEEEHAAEIEEALAEGRQLLRYGAQNGAIETFETVRRWCTYSTLLGGSLLLELGVAYDAVGRREEGAALFAQLVRSPQREIKRRAEQMQFQKEAAEFLKVDDEELSPEFAKLATIRVPRVAKAYSTTDAFLTSTKRKPVATLSEARTSLRSAAIRRDAGGAAPRMLQALDFIDALPRSELPIVSEVLARVQGEWLLGFTEAGGRFSFAPLEAMQQLDEASFERLEPSGPLGLLASLRGKFEIAGGEGGDERPLLVLEVLEARVGLLPLPVAPRKKERLLYLDSIMCILEAGGVRSVWVRPTMRSRSSEL